LSKNDFKRTKPKTLIPTLREKHRYISFQVISEEPISYSSLEYAIWNQFLDTFGEVGVAKMGMWLIKNIYDSEKQIAVIRCNNKSVHQIVGGLGLINRLGDTRVIFKILKISGTIRGLRKVVSIAGQKISKISIP